MIMHLNISMIKAEAQMNEELLELQTKKTERLRENEARRKRKKTAILPLGLLRINTKAGVDSSCINPPHQQGADRQRSGTPVNQHLFQTLPESRAAADQSLLRTLRRSTSHRSQHQRRTQKCVVMNPGIKLSK